MLTAERWVTHAIRVALEILRLGTNLVGNLGIGGIDGAKRDHKLFDFSLIE